MKQRSSTGGTSGEIDAFDPRDEGQPFGLAADVAEEIWRIVSAEARRGDRFDRAEAVRRFREVATRAAARGGLLHPAPGKVTRLEARARGRRTAADAFRAGYPGRRSLVDGEAQRWDALRALATTVAAEPFPAAALVPPAVELVPPAVALVPPAVDAPKARDADSPEQRLRVIPGGATGATGLPGDVIDELDPSLRAAAQRTRIHRGPDAAELAAAHGAFAVTYGEDVYFGRDEYRTDTAHGRQLIAHEVTHVAQSLRGMEVAAAAKRTDGTASGAGEAEADASIAVDIDKISGGFLKGELKASTGAGGNVVSGDAQIVKGPLKGLVDKIKISYNLTTKELKGQFVLSVDKLSSILPKGVSATGTVTLDIKKAPAGIMFSTASTVDVKVESLLGGKVKDLHVGDGLGATFVPTGDYKIGAVEVTFAEGTTLTVDSKTGVTGALKGSVQIGSLPRLQLEVSRGAKGLDVHVSTTIALSEISARLDGTVHVDYRNTPAPKLAFVADGPRIKDIPHGDLLAKLEGETDGQEITGKITAKPGAKFEYQNVKGTLQRGELSLLTGKKLEGDLEGTAEASIGTGQFAIGFHNGQFSWNAKGKVNLGNLTNNVLIGEVEAEAGSTADATFSSKGITFGMEALKGVQVTELRGNLTKKTFTIGVDMLGMAKKIEGKIPAVGITFQTATAKVAYDGASGVKLDGELLARATVKAKDGKTIAAGSAHLRLVENVFGGEINVDSFEISPYLKGNGLVLDLTAGVKSGTVEFEAPKLAKGKVDSLVLDLKNKNYGFDAQLDFDPSQKLLAGTKLHVKLADGVLSGDAKFKNEYVSGSLEMTRGQGTTSFHGKLDPKLGGLGKIGDNFLGAELNYATGQGLTAKGGFSLNGLSNMVGQDSKIELAYANGKLAVDGTLHAGTIQHVTYIGQNELRIHWEQGGKLSVRGQIDATVANLADVTLKVASGPSADGSGEADVDANTPRFYLSGKITSKGLQKYFPNVRFSEPTASVHVENGADGHWTYAVDEISTHVTGINGLDAADIALTASYTKGRGISASATINKLTYKQFNLNGKFSITDNKVDPAHLGMQANFPGVKLAGSVDVAKSELGGLSWKTHVEAVPSEGGPLSWVKSGSLDASMVNGKLTEAKGTLALKPPSFLPVEDPTLVIGYDGQHIVGTLTTQFASPLHKTAKGTLTLTIGGPNRFLAEIRMPVKLPGMKQADLVGRVTADGHVEIAAVLTPDGLPFIKQARIAITYANGAFVVGGYITLAPTDDYLIELGVEYDITNKQFHIKGLEPKHEDKEKDKPLATIKHDKHFPSIPLFGIGVLNVVLTMRLGMGVNINKPFIKFNTPKLIGGLEALESGQMPAIEFGGKIGMGAEMFVEFGVGIAGQIQLLIAKAEMGIEGVLKAGLTMNLQSDISGKFEHGKPLQLTLDPSVSAALKLSASLNAFLFAEVLWWTIIDKKWPLASIDLADIPLGEFHPFDPFRLSLGGGKGVDVETPKIKEDQSAMTEGAKKSAQAANDETAQKETKDKVRPVLARIRQVAHRFEQLPEGWQGKGLTVAPVEFDSWYGIDKDKWDTYREVADNAEAMVPEEACKTPTEKLSKAVAVLSKANPVLAGMLVLQWQRAQIAAQGINPDTGENVVAKQAEIQQLVANEYATQLIAWQAQVDADAQAHQAAVAKQGVDFNAAEQHHDASTAQTKGAFDQQTQKTDRELQQQKDKLASVQGAPPVAAPPAPKPVAPPATKLGKPAPIPAPPIIPTPAAPAPVPAVTLPALPADPGASAPIAARVPPAKAPRPIPAPVIAPPSPPKAPSSVAAANGGKSATSRGGGGGGGGPKGAGAPGTTGGGGGGGSSAPGPSVVAGPQGIIVQDQSLEKRRASLGGAAKPAAAPGAKPGAAPAGGRPASAGPPSAATGAPGGAAHAGPTATPGGPAAKPGGAAPTPSGAPDPTVQKVIDAGKADETKQKQDADAKAAAYQQKVDAEKKLVADAEAKAKAAKAAAAKPAPGAQPSTPGAAPGADGKAPTDGAPGATDGKPAEPTKPTEIGQRIPLSVLGESHTLYIETTGVPMVASTPTTVTNKLAELDRDISSVPAIKQLATASEHQASASAQTLTATTNKVASGDASLATSVTAQEQNLAAPLKTTWEWAKVAKDPAVSGGSIDKPLTHPYFPTFKSRIAKLSSLGHITTVDASAFAEATWIKICQAVKAATPVMTDPKAYSDFAKGWLDMKSPEFQKAIREFDAVTREISKAASNQFAQAQSFGFWSKDEGRTLAEAISGLTLETSAIGTLMDGLPTLDAKKAGWDPEVWGGLSNAYANAVVPEILKGKKVNVCIGAGVPAGNIWEAVESAALVKGLQRTKFTLEGVSKHYAAAAKSKANRRQLDETKHTGGITGCLFVGDRAGAIAAADAHFKSLPDAPATTTAAPTATTTPPAPPAPTKTTPAAPTTTPTTPAATTPAATTTTPTTAAPTPAPTAALVTPPAPAVAPTTPAAPTGKISVAERRAQGGKPPPYITATNENDYWYDTETHKYPRRDGKRARTDFDTQVEKYWGILKTLGLAGEAQVAAYKKYDPASAEGKAYEADPAAEPATDAIATAFRHALINAAIAKYGATRDSLDTNVFAKNAFAASNHNGIQGELWNEWVARNHLGMRRTKVKWVLRGVPDEAARGIESDGFLEGTDTFIETKAHSLSAAQGPGDVGVDTKQMDDYQRILGEIDAKKMGYYKAGIGQKGVYVDSSGARQETMFLKVKYVLNNARVSTAYETKLIEKGLQGKYILEPLPASKPNAAPPQYPVPDKPPLAPPPVATAPTPAVAPAPAAIAPPTAASTAKPATPAAPPAPVAPAAPTTSTSPPSPVAPASPAAPTTTAATTTAAPTTAAPTTAAPADPAATQQKSKYGVGPAPAGWAGRVRGTMPSEAVVSDDPGHTYHVLDDGKVVATTEPTLLAPDSAVSKHAAANKPPSEQLIVAACQRFEVAIGNTMARYADAAVQNLMSRVKNYIDVKIRPFAGKRAEVENALKGLGGGLYEQWAGRLSFKLEDIEAILNRGGNIREAITLFNNFVRNILEPDVAAGLPNAALVELLQEVKGLAPDAQTRMELALQLYNTRKAKAKPGVESVMGNKSGVTGALNETRTGAINPDVPNTNPVAGEMASAGIPSTGHIPSSDGRYETDGDRTGTVSWKKGERENDAWWLHKMTVEEFTALGGNLSAREKKLYNEGVYRQELAKRKASIVDQASFKKAVEEAEAEAKKVVPWAAGVLGYDMKWNAPHAVMEAFHKLSIPVGAGVSGTTARTMQSLLAVNIDATTGLKICLGYLLPIQAHSFSEVRASAAALGAGAYTPKRGSHNYNQFPIKSDIEGMADWAEFDRQFNPEAIGALAATK